MKIIVCVKAVPDPTSRLAVNESNTWIKEQDITFVINEADNYAIEEALRLKEAGSGEVVVLSMGGSASARALRTGLAMGADRAIHLLGAEFRGADEFATAQALFKAIEKDGGADLVLTGVQSDDLGTGATGVMLAEFLGWSHATVVIAVEADPDNRTVRVKQEREGGLNETVSLDLPAALTIQYGINQPRYASLKGIMAAKKKPFAEWSASDIGLGESNAGSAAAMYDVKGIRVPDRRSKVEIITGTPEEAALTLVEKLKKEAKVL